MSADEWVSLSAAASEMGLNRSSVSRAASRQGWPQRKEGRTVMVPRSCVAEYARARKRRRKPADAVLSLAEFARRAEVSTRAVQKWRSDGLIDAYTESELARVVGEQPESDDAPEAPDAEPAGDEALSPDMDLAALKRRKEYWATRKLKAMAMKFEGQVYDAAELDARARQIGQLIAARVHEVPQRWAERLANKPADEVRAALALWAQQFLGELDAALDLGDA